MQKSELISAETRIKTITEFLLKYFEENNIDRSSITTYKQIEDMNIKGCPVSLSKSTFTMRGFTTKDVMSIINPESQKTKLSIRLEKEAREHNIEVLNFDYSLKTTDSVDLLCSSCGYEESITIHSFLRRADKCKSCAGKLKWTQREEEFLDICCDLDIIPNYTDYTKVVESGSVYIECMNCGHKDYRNFEHLIHKRSFLCPVCNPIDPRQRGYKTVHNNLVFDSNIEFQAYLRLVELGVPEEDIKVHVPYSVLLNNPTIKLRADFLINDTVIEVTSFNRTHHEYYFIKMDKKRDLLKDSKYKFILLDSVAAINNLSIQDIVYSS